MEENHSKNARDYISYESISLQSRLKWSLFIRLIIAILALISILAYQKALNFFPPRLITAYAALVFACFINILYLISIRLRLLRLDRLALIQIAVDILIETLIIYLTGGIRNSIFIYLYFASIVAAAMLISARGSFLFASLASVFLSAITITYFLATHFEKSLPLLPADYVSSVTSELRFILPYLLFFALALHLVAFLAGRLSIELGHERILKDEILQEMTSGLIVVDNKGKIVFYNNQFKDLLGLPDEEILRKGNVGEILSDNQYDILKEALLKNISLRGEITISSKDKTSYIEFVTSNLKSGKDKPRGTIALLNDVTPNREMIEVSQRAKRWQSLSEMGTSIAHEIRNPLASIKSAAQELQVDAKLAADDKKLLNIITKESTRLNQIITEFLDFTRERPVALHECNINEVIDEVCVLLERKEFERKVKIEKDIKGNIKCKADAEQLKQVLLNLGINAFESGTNKVVFRMYQSRSQYNEAGVIIEVEDFGKGIESKEADKIFDPFFTTKPKGVGMGLAIARKIIQLHKGKIYFESIPFKGTKFTIWLPSA